MRYLELFIIRDLMKKMVFLGGPRQCGKTTFSKQLLSKLEREQHLKGAYFNWDRDEHRRAILKEQWSETDRFLVFDELHKFRRWKNWLKGLYDTLEIPRPCILVTGSARMDLYKQGGDSLMGRYHYWRLHPFSLSEIPNGLSPTVAFERLMKIGGFPEPFLDGNEREARRWRRERLDKVLKEDVRDLESIKDIGTLSVLVDLLRSRVGGLIVISNLKEDLQVDDKTIKKWIGILERMYLIFSIRPYTTNLPRAIQKPAKIYFFDTGDISENDGSRFENLVATHLLKEIHFKEDITGYRYELRYIRDKEKREVDFVILKDGKVEELIEAKYSESSLSSSLVYYAGRLKPTRVCQIVATLKRGFSSGKAEIMTPYERFGRPLVE